MMNFGDKGVFVVLVVIMNFGDRGVFVKILFHPNALIFWADVAAFSLVTRSGRTIASKHTPVKSNAIIFAKNKFAWGNLHKITFIFTGTPFSFGRLGTVTFIVFKHNYKRFCWWCTIIRTHDLCDAGAVLYQLSYQANWELVILRNLSSCEKKAWKKFRLERDSNPWPLRCRCSALPTEPSSQLGAISSQLGAISFTGILRTHNMTRGPFLESPGNFRAR